MLEVWLHEIEALANGDQYAWMFLDELTVELAARIEAGEV